MPLSLLSALLCALALAACGGDEDGGAEDTTPGAAPATTEQAPVRTQADAPVDTAQSEPETVATGLEVPWGLAFLPGGDALVSERDSGRILRIPNGGGAPRQVMRLEEAAGGSGEGGLLGLAVSPAYARDGLVYAYLTTASDNRIVRFKLGGPREVILDGLSASAIHNGGRIAFGPDGKLYVGVGDAGDTGLAQDTSSRNGKILRLDPDGAVPEDNPDNRSPVYSLGHRNPQGLAWDSADRLWAAEFGQDAFDEVNLIRGGGNYGWPEAEGFENASEGDFVAPKAAYPTSEASPSGIAIAGGVLYMGALRGEKLIRLRLSGNRARKLPALFDGELGRIRTVAAAPDGTVWLTTSNRDGRGSPRSGDDRIVSFRP